MKNNYRSMLKGTVIFGGSQVFTIIIGLIRAKLVAIFLGPAGVGISSLLTSTVAMLQQFSSFGVNLSAVKNIAQAKEEKTSLTTLVFNYRLLLVLLGSLGASISVLFADYLSFYTFGNHDYTVAFRLLGIYIFFTTLSGGELSILQGKRELKKVAVSSVIGSVIGLILGVPFYYFWGIKGIVPAMVVMAICNYLANRLLSTSDYKLSIIKLERSTFVSSSKEMMTLGIVLMISTLLGTVATYLLNAYISRQGGLVDVGFFQSANSLTNQYTGIVFTSMAIDYFPKLAAKADSVIDINRLVNEQLEIAILLIAPIVALFLVFSTLIVNLLLTKEFLVVVPVLNLMAFGVFVKAISYPLGYISFAKGDKKLFFWLEGVFANVLQLSLNILFYSYFGLLGLGFSFILIFCIYFIVLFIVVKKRYSFQIKKEVIRILLSFFFLIGAVFLVNFITYFPLKALLFSLLLPVLLYFSITELDKRIKVLSLIKSKIFKKNG
ncbi:O-antigen translocase [Sphingobacterium kitahiroshimense]|uniref:O-antigen translocase n=1 Tax=Sphingobacterium kitahiroshimense TaxID=470446 RepID=A0ABV0C2N2_9SPHI